jgi:hypothetical protein
VTLWEREPGLLVHLLSDAFGVTVAIRHVERLAPWFVSRVYLADQGSSVPPSVIVKWSREHPSDIRTDPTQVLTERASLEFLAELDLHVAPRLLAADDDAGILVLEDLAPRVSLYELLRTGDHKAPLGLQTFARTMGELHAATAGRADAYYDRRESLGPVDPSYHRRRIVGESWTWTLPRLDAFGVHLSVSAEAEMALVRDILLEPGSFIAFSNGDSGANNFFVDGSDGRIIDWEFGGYRHALIDAACLYVPGPIWMSVADPTASGIDDIYREALTGGVSSATDDDVFAPGMAAACVAMAIERLERLPKLDARPAGHESRAQMVSTLEAAARAAEHLRSFPHLTGWAYAAASMLRRRWPDADREFPDAYTTRE